MVKEELIERLVENVDKVFFYCVKRCNNRMDAEDLSQTILLEVMNNINKGIQINNFNYYLWTVCKNQYNRYLKNIIKDRETFNLVEDIDEPADNISVLDEMIYDENIIRMNAAIKLLSLDYSKILYAYYVEDKKLSYIAEELGLPLGTVGRKLSEIRKKLKEYLDMERLNGKKAYIPKSFAAIQSFIGEPDFDPAEETSLLLIKNLLFHSYDNPCSLIDYSIELGIAITYIEDIVARLLEKDFLIKVDNDKYLTNIAFVDKIKKRKIFDLVRNNISLLQDNVVNFCKKNINKYKELVKNKELPDELLMWSLMLIVITSLKTNDEKEEYSKKYQNGSWDFCMEEITNDHEYDEYFISCDASNNPTVNMSVFAWPAGVDNKNFKVGNRISLHNGGSAKVDLSVFYWIINKAPVKYSEVSNKDLKKVVDKYIERNYLRLEDDVLKINPPVISRTNLNKLHQLIKEDETLQNAVNKYNLVVHQETQNYFPLYLNTQMKFIISAFTNNARSLIINYAYEQGLLSLDEDHKYFAYNMLVIKDNE